MGASRSGRGSRDRTGSLVPPGRPRKHRREASERAAARSASSERLRRRPLIDGLCFVFECSEQSKNTKTREDELNIGGRLACFHFSNN
ncbi:hypothetical protein EYF80_064190 [Liparis tanakae]|uniref:Uncharacterized protein n=1 Tax=Liparis tanakae TaxID=230148 RepID=A0A4Z2EA43_9TELE|nr:hypothetical protein EYF80_064190 [Liparis tanakae]